MRCLVRLTSALSHSHTHTHTLIEQSCVVKLCDNLFLYIVIICYCYKHIMNLNDSRLVNEPIDDGQVMDETIHLDHQSFQRSTTHQLQESYRIDWPIHRLLWRPLKRGSQKHHFNHHLSTVFLVFIVIFLSLCGISLTATVSDLISINHIENQTHSLHVNGVHLVHNPIINQYSSENESDIDNTDSMIVERSILSIPLSVTEHEMFVTEADAGVLQMEVCQVCWCHKEEELDCRYRVGQSSEIRRIPTLPTRVERLRIVEM